MAENYVGKILFLEKKDGWYNGEYIIVQQSPSTLYGVKCIGGYNGHELREFSTVGEKKYDIVSVNEDDTLCLKVAEELEYFSETPKRGEHKQWVDYVYSGAANNARLLRKAIENKNGGKGPTANTTKEVQFEQPSGVSISVNIFGKVDEVKEAISKLNKQLNG